MPSIYTLPCFASHRTGVIYDSLYAGYFNYACNSYTRFNSYGRLNLVGKSLTGNSHWEAQAVGNEWILELINCLFILKKRQASCGCSPDHVKGGQRGNEEIRREWEKRGNYEIYLWPSGVGQSDEKREGVKSQPIKLCVQDLPCSVHCVRLSAEISQSPSTIHIGPMTNCTYHPTSKITR